jgi:hypothetical protein
MGLNKTSTFLPVVSLCRLENTAFTINISLDFKHRKEGRKKKQEEAEGRGFILLRNRYT